MKITVDIADTLLREVRKIATRDGTTLRALVEQGLHLIIAERRRNPAFHLRKASFKGRGLRAELRKGGWKRLRGLAYETPD